MSRVPHNLRLRRPHVADLEPLGSVIFSAFSGVAAEFRYAPTFPDHKAGVREAARLISSPRFFGFVATVGGRLAGAAFGMDGDEVAGIGPIVVEPTMQGMGIGRGLMQALMADVRSRGYGQARLQQDAPNIRSMTLYATEGFDLVDTCMVLEAPPVAWPLATVAQADALSDLGDLCRRIYGVSRSTEIADAIPEGRVLIALGADARIAGYVIPSVFGHGAALDGEAALRLALHASSVAGQPVRCLVFLRQTDLYRRAIALGCRPIKVMNLMSWGPYVRPGSYSLASISF